MKHDPRALDYHILSALSRWHSKATYAIRNSIRYSEGTKWSGLETCHVLTACRRLEKRGHVKEAESAYLTMKVWEITDAGRQAILLSMEDGK